MRSVVAFAVLATVVSAMPLVEKRTGGEVHTSPPGMYCSVDVEVMALIYRSSSTDVEKRTGGEVYITPPGTSSAVPFNGGTHIVS